MTHAPDDDHRVAQLVRERNRLRREQRQLEHDMAKGREALWEANRLLRREVTRRDRRAYKQAKGETPEDLPTTDVGEVLPYPSAGAVTEWVQRWREIEHRLQALDLLIAAA